MRVGWLLVWLALCGWPALSASEVTITGAQAEMTWTEPTVNADGSPLTDLTQTRGTFQTPAQPETVCEGPVPASSPTGGAEVMVRCTVPVAQGAETPITFRAYAQDDNGNVSKPAELHKIIDLLEPDSPTF